MWISKLFRALLFCLIIWGCSTTKAFEKSVFTFLYNGDTYEIVSFSSPDRLGYNLLQMSDNNGELLLKAQDFNSNGSLDTLLTGKITLGLANEIYSYGIDEAIRTGRFETRSDVRKYELIRNEGIYIVETIGYDDHEAPQRLVYGYMSDPVPVYNQFVFIDSESQSKNLFRDIGPDGRLSLSGQSESTVNNPQELYNLVIENGIREGRIKKMQDMFIVQTLERGSF